MLANLSCFLPPKFSSLEQQAFIFLLMGQAGLDRVGHHAMGWI